MNEILTCVKLIKMYAWEKSFAIAIGKTEVIDDVGDRLFH